MIIAIFFGIGCSSARVIFVLVQFLDALKQVNNADRVFFDDLHVVSLVDISRTSNVLDQSATLLYNNGTKRPFICWCAAYCIQKQGWTYRFSVFLLRYAWHSLHPQYPVFFLFVFILWKSVLLAQSFAKRCWHSSYQWTFHDSWIPCAMPWLSQQIYLAILGTLDLPLQKLSLLWTEQEQNACLLNSMRHHSLAWSSD